MSVGARIKNYLTSHGISQAWLCEMTGMTPAKMSLALSEQRKLSVGDYERIVGALGVDGGAFIEPKSPEDCDEPAE